MRTLRRKTSSLTLLALVLLSLVLFAALWPAQPGVAQGRVKVYLNCSTPPDDYDFGDKGGTIVFEPGGPGAHRLAWSRPKLDLTDQGYLTWVGKEPTHHSGMPGIMDRLLDWADRTAAAWAFGDIAMDENVLSMNEFHAIKAAYDKPLDIRPSWYKLDGSYGGSWKTPTWNYYRAGTLELETGADVGHYEIHVSPRTNRKAGLIFLAVECNLSANDDASSGHAGGGGSGGGGGALPASGAASGAASGSAAGSDAGAAQSAPAQSGAEAGANAGADGGAATPTFTPTPTATPLPVFDYVARIFDFDGDGLIDEDDLNAGFQPRYEQCLPEARVSSEYCAAIDYDGNHTISIEDFIVFRDRHVQSAAENAPPTPIPPAPTDTPMPPPEPPAQPSSYGIDLNGWCRQLGHQGAVLNGSDAYSWQCQAYDGSGVGLDINTLCRETYGSNYEARAADFNDPFSWQCVAY